MLRNELEKKILEQYPELMQTNLKMLLKPHLESWVENDEVTLSSERLLKIFLERNERASINTKLNRENFGLRAKIDATVRDFVTLQNSEIFKAGQWLLNSFSKSKNERRTSLLDRNLVHKDDYNNAITDLKNTIGAQKEGINKQTKIATTKIKALEDRNDSLRKQLILIQDYIIKNYSNEDWSNISQNLQGNLNKN